MNEVFQKRHSIRNFQNREIELNKLAEILEAANSSPSAGNLKGREIVVVQDQKIKEDLVNATALRRGCKQEFISQAAVVLVFFAIPERAAEKYGDRGASLYCVQDATIAASFAWLQAVMLGLSAVWVGSFDEEKVKRVLAVDDGWRPVAFLPIGYENEKAIVDMLR